MKRYYKIIEEGYLTVIGTGADGEEISVEEYDIIFSVIRSRPTAEPGYGYRLKADLTWELVELPTEPEDPEISDEEAMNIILGGAV